MTTFCQLCNKKYLYNLCGMIDLPTRTFSSQPASHVVLLMHGYGADGHDLIDLAEPLSTALPHAVFYSPHAPDEGMFGGRQWFPLSRMNMDEVNDGADAALPFVNTLADTLLAHNNVPPQNLIIGGFSQGCMMALHAGLRRAVPPAAIVGFGGLLPAPEALPQQMTGKPPVFLAHGSDDQVVSAAFARQARTTLQALDVFVQLDIVQGLGHGIAPSSLRKATEFLTRQVGA